MYAAEVGHTDKSPRSGTRQRCNIHATDHPCTDNEVTPLGGSPALVCTLTIRSFPSLHHHRSFMHNTVHKVRFNLNEL